MSDATLSTLGNIRTKVRRLTRTPSVNQMPDTTLDEYVNNFVLYDFPEQLRLFSLRKTLTFWTQPYIDTYSTTTANPLDPLFNFKNLYTSVHPQVYLAGSDSLLSQSKQQFFSMYPMVNQIASTGFIGNGVTVAFTGTLPAMAGAQAGRGILRNNVLFTSIDALNNGLGLYDVPVDPEFGQMFSIGSNVVTGAINYLTGWYTILFPAAPAIGAAINSQVIPYIASQPQAMLYFDDTFTIRPVPDKVYRVDLEAYQRPTELLQTAQQPELAAWWQYIAIGAAIKIYQDRLDLDSVQQLMPEFKNQERLILRRTLMQLSNERTETIYSGQGVYGYGSYSQSGTGF